MPTFVKVSPTRLPVTPAARLGSPRRFSAVAPFVRASLTLRRLEIFERAGVARHAATLPVAQEAADACRAV